MTSVTLASLAPWLIIGLVLFIFWQGSRNRVWRKVSFARAGSKDAETEMPVTKSQGNLVQVEDALVWKEKPTIAAAIWAFGIGCAALAIHMAIGIDSRLPAPRSYVLVDRIFPPWHHPLDPGAYILLGFNLVPLICFALAIWCIGGETSYRLSTNCLERKIRWFRFEKAKTIHDATIRLEAKSESAANSAGSIWQWTIEVKSGGKSLCLFSESATSGPYLSVSEPESIVAKLSERSGWPIEEMVSHEGRPQPSDSGS